MQMDLIDSGVAAASENMARDEELLRSLNDNSKPILHFYDWQTPSATFGYFCSPHLLLNAKGIEKYHLELARRPTGGGIIFHQFDFAFSFLLPAKNPNFSLNTLDNYCYVNKIIANAIQDFLAENQHLELLASPPHKNGDVPQKNLGHFCMARPTVHDVVSEGRKVVGGAQKRTKNGFLHQASIALLVPPDEFLTEVIQADAIIAPAIRKFTFPLLKMILGPSEREKAKTTLKARLIEEFSTVVKS